MKLQLLFTCLLIVNFSLFAQENSQEKEIITVDEEASFPGGRSAMMQFLAKNLHYPERAIENEFQGKVHVRFIVETDGSISDIKVQKGIPDCPECDEEAIRVIKTMPTWIPGKVQSKPVRSYFQIPVPFKLY